MPDELSLLEHCKNCGNSCCKGDAVPRLSLKEMALIEKETEIKLFPENGYWVIKKKGGTCVFLKNELCTINEIKPVDCRIFPIDPAYDSKGDIYWVIDEECPASPHLKPEFYAHAIFQGTKWLPETDIRTFKIYWKKHKLNNPDQRLVELSNHLESKTKDFLIAIRNELQRLVGADLKEWLEKNKSIESLRYILDA